MNVSMSRSLQKHWLVGLILILVAPLAHAKPGHGRLAAVAPVVAAVTSTTAAPSVLSFKEWKNGKITTSQLRMRQLQMQYQDQRAYHPGSPRLPMLQQDLAQEQWNLEVARDLSARDYLYLYVKNQDQRLSEIAARLSPEEVSLMLESYFQLIDRSQKNQELPAKRSRLGTQTQ